MLLCAALALLPACGLFTTVEPIGFRSYPLHDVTLPEASELVDRVTREFALSRWGGVGMTWEDNRTRLHLDPIYDGQRRLRLYVELVAQGPDVDVQMFALVETLQLSGTQVGWTDNKQDVPLEENLYQAYVDALVALRSGAPVNPPGTGPGTSPGTGPGTALGLPADGVRS